jgi:hypothetical protein
MLLMLVPILQPDINFDKHYMDNIISWWKRKATSRYDNLVAEGRLRRDLEVWNADSIGKIDIIR